MKGFNSLATITAILFMSLCEDVNAGGPTSFMTKTYYNDDGSYAVSTISKGRGGGLGPDGYYFTYYDKDGNAQAGTNNDFNYIKYDKDGNVVSEYNYYGPRPTYIIDENNNVVGKKACFTCDTVENYQYTESGKMLVYRTDGTFVGAYDDILDYHTVAQAGLDSYNPNWHGYSEYVGNLSLVSEDGNFYDKDNNGRVVGIYNQNGDVTKYKYDSGGNMIGAYKNGNQIYAKTIYTPAEAAAATKPTGNIVSITW